jgi:CheY-like chemotaxis protein
MGPSKSLITILLADDDKDDRFFFREAFEEIEAGTIVKTVNDGEQLMNYLKQSPLILPNIVFMDLNMPLKGGLECLEEIRSSDELKDLVVAIYSTSSSPRDISESFSRGASIYIKKPDGYSSLIKILSSVMNMDWKSHVEGLTKESFVLNIPKNK